MQIEQEVELCEERKGVCKKRKVLFDTGAKASFIDKEFAEEFGYTETEPYEIMLATKDKKATIVGEAILRVELDGCKMPQRTILNVIENLTRPVILGAEFMELFDVELDMKKGRAKLRQCPPELFLV